MPNWCDTTYKCVGGSNEVKELYNVLERINNSKKKEHLNILGSIFLDELITGLGYDYEKYPYPCRGRITSYEYDNEILTIYQETAWCEQEGARRAIEEKFPSIKVYYLDEESGNDYYQTNDKSGDFFPDKYFLDGEDICEYFEDLDSLRDFLKEKYNIETKDDINDVFEKIDLYVGDDDDDWLSLHEIVRADN